MINEMIFERWKQIVETNEENVAIISDEKQFSYRQLDDDITRFADIIRGFDADRIVIKMESSMEYWVTVMATLKAGKTFIPIDTNLPEERVQYILETSNSNQVIDIQMFRTFMEGTFDSKKCNVRAEGSKNKISYIIFTSGTTGKPKGVMIATESLINLIDWFGKKYKVDNTVRLLQLANVSFDVSIEEYFGILLNGGCVIIPDKKCKSNPILFKEYVTKYKVNIVQMIPRMADYLIADPEKIDCLEHIIVGAEQLNKVTKQNIIEKGYSLHNHYGPTEATVDALVDDCLSDEEVNIGKPIDNMHFLIQNVEGVEIKDTEVEGELILYGKGVAVGYCNNKEETKKRFFSYKGYRAYRTGDIVKLNEQGKVIFIGRNDGQIKINGKRIELDEIQTCAKEHISGIGDCVVYVVNDNNSRIVAFSWTGNVEKSDIKKKLVNYLPDYMVPIVYVKIDVIPTTANDKIDFERLYLEYEKHKELNQENTTVQLSDEETKIVEIISEYADIEETEILSSMNSTIEQLGIDSLAYVQIVLEIETEFDIELGDDFLIMSDLGTIKEMLKNILGIIQEG